MRFHWLDYRQMGQTRRSAAHGTGRDRQERVPDDAIRTKLSGFLPLARARDCGTRPTHPAARGTSRGVRQMPASAVLGLVLLILCAAQPLFAGLWVTPGFVGNAESDSVVVAFCTFDTTLYPTIADVDSVVALRYGPDNTLVDSLDANDVDHPRTGWYEIHYRGANASGDLGTYRVFVRVWQGGDWRGAAVGSYEVIDNQLGAYLASLSADADSIKDTLNSLMHSGEPISVDSAQLARSVWDDDIVARNGRRIGWVDTSDIVNSIPSTGSGAYACTLYVMESSTAAAVPGASVRALNSSETATAASGEADSNGRLLFALDAAEYHLLPYANGYAFTPLPETLTVTTGGANDTLWATRFDPGEPPLPALCRVFGYVQSLGSNGLSGVTVTASVLTTPLRFGNVVISPYSLSTVTDENGYWYLDLIPCDYLSPSGTVYDFTMYDQSGTVLHRQYVVPIATTSLFQW